MSRPGWDSYFMAIADLAAARSTCPRRHVGAVLARDQRVVATGYNGSLRGQPHCTEVGCLMVGGHCKRTVHAELNALLQCALHGASSRGSTLFTTTFPCPDCARALVQAGVVRVVHGGAYGMPADASLVAEMLAGAGVQLQRGPAADASAAAAGPAAPLRALGARSPSVDESAFIAGSAEVDGDVTIGAEASVWYGAVLRGDIAPIRLGARSNVQDGCVLHTDEGHPCVVGEGVTVGHRAVLHGCRVGGGALIGMGALVLTGADVGDGAVVAAGALVAEGMSVPARSVVMGVPARVVRPVRPEEARRALEGAAHYVALAALHRAGGAGGGPGAA